MGVIAGDLNIVDSEIIDVLDIWVEHDSRIRFRIGITSQDLVHGFPLVFVLPAFALFNTPDGRPGHIEHFGNLPCIISF